jgi:hypothetical protein
MVRKYNCYSCAPTHHVPVGARKGADPLVHLFLLLHLVAVPVVEEEEALLRLLQLQLRLLDGLNSGFALHQLVLPAYTGTLSDKVDSREAGRQKAWLSIRVGIL